VYKGPTTEEQCKANYPKDYDFNVRGKPLPGNDEKK
jgi:hypothetical protein